MIATRMTSSASNKILELMQEEDNLDLMLRVFIQGGGCSGFKYGFSFELEKKPGDYIYETQIVKIASDASAYSIINLYALYQILCKEHMHFTLITLMADFLLSSVSMTSNKVALLVDQISVQYLRNAVIDYKSGIEGEYFTVINPDAKTTCGCGSSFSIDTSTVNH